MPTLALHIAAHRSQWPKLEQALEDLGALAVTLVDAAENPIYEPAPGHTPLWDKLVAQALFAPHIDRRGLIHCLQDMVSSIDERDLRFEEVEDRDWTRAWMDQYRPMRFGRRLWVTPTTERPDASALAENSVIVELDPGLAFGTGTHPTTALCLAYLESLELAEKTIVDYGCGSGILAIAALKLGAARAFALDIDPQALLATRENAARNAVVERIATLEPSQYERRPEADVIVANILAEPLLGLRDAFVEMAKPGALLCLSGILENQAEEVARHYRAIGSEIITTILDGWARLTARIGSV